MASVSIIMPAYNAEETIANSIDSVLAQTFSDFELIVCDDNSKDSTRSIIQAYVIKDSRVVLINNIFEKGAAGARNSCLAHASSQYISFLDSDDLWHEDKLNIQLEFMKNNGVAMSHSDYMMFDSLGYSKYIKSPLDVSFEDIVKKCNIGCLTVMIDTNITGEVCFPYTPKEDYALWMLILKNGITSLRCDSAMAFYRKQDSSLSSSKFSEIFKQWYVLREVGELSSIKSLYCLLTYAFNGLFKHYLKG